MNSAAKRPPDSVVGRLPRYFRALRELLARDTLRVSSTELSALLDYSASQIRSDLSYFGEFGQQGYGYNVRLLYSGRSGALGVTDDFSAVVIGSGDADRAVASDSMFSRHGIILRGVFSDCPSHDGSDMPYSAAVPKPIASLEASLCEKKADIAVLCSLCGIAEDELSRILRSGGVRAVWNAGGAALDRALWSDMYMRDFALCDPLMGLCCQLKYDGGEGL
ncbi:MAG: winged-helix domain-containing protein [Eubacteriales bacterium]